jgi:DNA polymerase/3'-5' exonuclease PolX
MSTGATDEYTTDRRGRHRPTRYPPGLRDLVNVPGLGPKRAQALHQRLKIGSLDLGKG